MPTKKVFLLLSHPLESYSPGKMTLGVYKDSSCQKQASYSFSDYQSKVSGSVLASDDAFDKWNEMMSSYKICQPCRAYNKEYTYQYEWRRNLAEENDGQGAEESNGYNCYDDAGYRK